MVGEPYRVDRRRTSHEAYGGALQAGVQTKTVYQHLVYAGRDKARAGDEQQMRRRLHILILAQGADSLLAQFYALRFEPLHPLGGAGKCAEPVETLAVGGLEIIKSEEHTSELQSLMRSSYAVFCLKKKHNTTTQQSNTLNHNTTN